MERVYDIEERLTGNRDIDRKLLLDLDDKSLARLCTTRRWIRQCNDKELWRLKLYYLFEGLLSLIPDEYDYQQIYKDTKKLAKQYHRRRGYAMNLPPPSYELQFMKHEFSELNPETVRFYFDLYSDSLLRSHPTLMDQVLEYSLTKNVDTARIALEHGAEVEGWEINTAVTEDNYELLRLLLEASAPQLLDTAPYRPLIHAAEKDNPRAVRLLLVYGANPNIANGEPLLIASQFGFYEVAKVLLEFGADPNISEEDPLELAIEEDNTKVARLLEDYE
jgi:hypothetical protein